MRCLHCQKFDLRSHRDHSRVGLGNCLVGPSYSFYGIERDEPCKDFAQAASEAVAKREEWEIKRNQSAHIG
jgi:hypothetical protein